MPIEYPDVAALSNKELFSLFLRESLDSPVVEELSSRYSDLRIMARATGEELKLIKGIGPGKAKVLMVFVELAKRLNSPPPGEPKKIKSPQDVSDLVMGEMRLLDREHFRALLLNTKHHVLRMETVSIGSLSSSLVHPRELFKSAIKFSAAAVILIHNHPSGDPAPSREDIDITKRLVEAGKLLGIEVLDHVIVGHSFVSMKEKGLL
ncbi:MAG: RadC family protein [Bacillota bacterium]